MNAERLLKLADHLENGKLGHEVFDFGQYNAGDMNKNGCGTNGCAIGECPIVFPEDWEFRGLVPKLIAMPTWDATDSGQFYFDITLDQYKHLFIPECQIEEYGGIELYENATKEQVAANIREFVKRKS